MKNVVRDLRVAQGLSQAELGDALSVSRQTINAIETGRYMPSLPLAFSLAKFFSTTVESIFEPEDQGAIR
ncbi:MAG: putative transcriptional regulator [Actinomycetota bacterium]|jgi:putative transcriptional regulator|nr:putative transcriptional regulator [Actinomycetota bacterium]